jgi:hypothetical protein
VLQISIELQVEEKRKRKRGSMEKAGKAASSCNNEFKSFANVMHVNGMGFDRTHCCIIYTYRAVTGHVLF